MGGGARVGRSGHRGRNASNGLRVDPRQGPGQGRETDRAGGHGSGGILEAGDGFVAELIGYCIGASPWDPDTALDAPLGIVILGIRAERREADGCKGFGWVQLDEFSRQKEEAENNA